MIRTFHKWDQSVADKLIEFPTNPVTIRKKTTMRTAMIEKRSAFANSQVSGPIPIPKLGFVARTQVTGATP